jgi:mannose-6-phosphate isomerase-like protein (cupin superfamily)
MTSARDKPAYLSVHHAFVVQFRSDTAVEQRPGFTNKVMVKTATFTVGAVAVTEEIRPHRHHDGTHVLYIVSGGGTMTHGDQTITLKPGMIVHVPVGVAHGIRAEGGELTPVDFAQPSFDPDKMEWIK